MRTILAALALSPCLTCLIGAVASSVAGRHWLLVCMFLIAGCALIKVEINFTGLFAKDNKQ